MKKKKVLIIAFYYPPDPIIGARRISKISKVLLDLGWEPHIITTKYKGSGFNVELDIPEEFVHYIEWSDLWETIEKLDKGSFSRKFATGFKVIIGEDYRMKRWVQNAEKKAIEVIKEHSIDIIYSTFSPKENIMVANKLANQTGLPWVNEYRDLWYGNPYSVKPRKKQLREFKLEKELISSANSLVTISESLKEDLIQFHNKPTHVVYNGYDKLDDSKSIVKNNDGLKIIYTGILYREKRDPKLLFEAIESLKKSHPNLYSKIRISFYGKGIKQQLLETVKRMNITECVSLNEPIAHKEVVRLQKEADILLLLGWNNPKEKGIATGKLFEYFGRKKPVLAITYPHGVVKDLLSDTNLGKVFTSVSEIKEYLISCLEKKSNGELLVVPNEKGLEKYSQVNQVQQLESIFKTILNK